MHLVRGGLQAHDHGSTHARVSLSTERGAGPHEAKHIDGRQRRCGRSRETYEAEHAVRVDETYPSERIGKHHSGGDVHLGSPGPQHCLEMIGHFSEEWPWRWRHGPREALRKRRNVVEGGWISCCETFQELRLRRRGVAGAEETCDLERLHSSGLSLWHPPFANAAVVRARTQGMVRQRRGRKQDSVSHGAARWGRLTWYAHPRNTRVWAARQLEPNLA
mmetsp:Transcript_91931/g.259699  ORF Transcript_91931/g.259699 Transcript_91931/m.259699 type:complete len:219 (-) Transcript_91931:8-664(-)